MVFDTSHGTGLDQTITLRSLDVEIALADLYEAIAFAEQSDPTYSDKMGSN